MSRVGHTEEEGAQRAGLRDLNEIDLVWLCVCMGAENRSRPTFGESGLRTIRATCRPSAAPSVSGGGMTGSAPSSGVRQATCSDGDGDGDEAGSMTNRRGPLVQRAG